METGLFFFPPLDGCTGKTNREMLVPRDRSKTQAAFVSIFQETELSILCPPLSSLRVISGNV